jgi:glyceraldehyde-3-phosphate dehydrogenase (NADP+)
MKFYLNGSWQDRDEKIEVINPFDSSVLDTVPSASASDIELAFQSAEIGRKAIGSTSGYQRYQILRAAADLMRQQESDLARTISQEEGKTLREATAEVQRSITTMELSSEEAKRISGEVLPLDGDKGNQGRLGFTLRVPCGVVVAITPFNFPLNLVCHKVGPAIAAGNSVILKPASDTPLVALKLVEILLQAGLHAHAINCITGSGSKVGTALCSDPRVRKISFTGSKPVGEQICKIAGIKRVTMELGSNCPLVVLPDANMEKVAKATLRSGFANAGQVCISAQRLVVVDEVHEQVIDSIRSKVSKIVSGDPLANGVTMGPMVRETDAVRVQGVIQSAVEQGAKLICGGQRNGAIVEPTIVDGATSDMSICRDELFGPAVAVMRVRTIDEAIQVANDTEFGLSAGVFTENIDNAMRFAKEIQSGNIQINWGPMWRTDGMPYGGLKNSGLGKEGPRYAVEEMTETKAVVIHSY